MCTPYPPTRRDAAGGLVWRANVFRNVDPAEEVGRRAEARNASWSPRTRGARVAGGSISTFYPLRGLDVEDRGRSRGGRKRTPHAASPCPA